MPTANQEIEELASKEYAYGFTSDIESESIPAGLSEEVSRTIIVQQEGRAAVAAGVRA